MSNPSQSAKKVQEQPDLIRSVVAPKLPGQNLISPATSPKSGRLPGSKTPVSDLRSEVKSAPHFKPQSSSKLPLPPYRLPSTSNPRSDLHRLQSAANKMRPLGYLGGTASSALKSKLPRKVTSGNRILAPHPQPSHKTLSRSQTTAHAQQSQIHQGGNSTDAALATVRESAPISRNNSPTSHEHPHDNEAIGTDPIVARFPDYDDDCSLSAAASGDFEHQQEELLFTSHEDVLSLRGEWDDEVTLLDVVPDSDCLHESIAKIINQDFTQSTRTLVDESDHVSKIGKFDSLDGDTRIAKPLDLDLDATLQLEPGKAGLVRLNKVEAQELLEKLKVAEEQIVKLAAENAQQRVQIDETESRIHSLREDNGSIVAKAELKVQECDALISSKEAENTGLLAQVHKQSLAVQDLENLYEGKCNECDELISASHFEHPSVSEKKFVVEELARTRDEHEKALQAAEARFQNERDGNLKTVSEQEEEIQVSDDLIAQLESEVAVIRDSLHDAEGRAELNEDLLRQKDNDFAALQNAITDMWRREHVVGKPARRQIARLEFHVQKLREENKNVKNEAKLTEQTLKEAKGKWEVDESALCEELGQLQHLNIRLESEATRAAGEMEKLRSKFKHADEMLRCYEMLGPVRDITAKDLEPKYRLSESAKLASSDPVLLAAELKKAFSKIHAYEMLGVAKTLTPLDERELEVIEREREVVMRERATVEREEENQRVAGGLGTEVLVLKAQLQARKERCRVLERMIRGLEKDLSFLRGMKLEAGRWRE